MILGVCNPQPAHRAPDVETEVSFLLTCHVVVHRDWEKVSVACPTMILGIAGTPQLMRWRGLGLDGYFAQVLLHQKAEVIVKVKAQGLAVAINARLLQR